MLVTQSSVPSFFDFVGHRTAALEDSRLVPLL